MVRLLPAASIDRLNNRNLCGIDTPFCYPISRPYDNVMYYKLPAVDTWQLFEVSVMDSTGTNTLYTINTLTELGLYFAWVIATDSNGDAFLILRQRRPFFNLGGDPGTEITCYSLYITLSKYSGSSSFISEPVCSVERYCTTKYQLVYPPTGVADLTFTITCNGVSSGYNYNNLPLGAFFEYPNAFPTIMNLYLPEGCTLDALVNSGGPINYFDQGEVCFGANNCNSFVQIHGAGQMMYDCNGQFFGEIITANFINTFYEDAILNNASEINTNVLTMNVPGSLVKQIESKSTLNRVKQSCYVPSVEVVDRYKVYSTCPVPMWFQKEIDNVASMQTVYLTGTSPLVDDYNDYIMLVQGGEYAWKPRQYGNYAFPALIFETCVCFKDFSC